MKKCAECGATGTALVRSRLATYEETILEMPITLINSVDRYTCKKCDHAVNVVPNNEGLIAAVSLCRILMPRKLHGSEIRLLRTVLNMKSKQLAKTLAVTPETMSRWERGYEVFSAQAEKSFRVLVAVTMKPKAPAMDVDLQDILKMDIKPLLGDGAANSNVEPIYLEAVRMKEDTKKQTQYDKAEAEAA